MRAAPPLASPFVEVAIPVALRQLFTYRVPEALAGQLRPGARVAVPFHRRKLAGFVVRGRDEAPEGVKRVLSVAGLLEEEPIFPAELFAFLDEAARYYLHPLGEVLRAAAPALPTGALRRLAKGGFLAKGETLPGRKVAHVRELFATRTEAAAPERLGSRQRALLAVLEERGEELALTELRGHVKEARQVLRGLAEKGLVALTEREVLADPFFGKPVARAEPPELNAAQAHARDALLAALGEDAPGAFLLHGVTGSGKTEVYLRVIAAALERGQGALLLVPEIALTPQLVHRFRARFGDGIAVLHSALGEKERDEAWRRLRRGDLRLALGARSALFAPVPDLGVLVVDEEHDGSFKQEEGFRYQARDMALLRAQRAGALCVLGSATPSLETFERARQGRLGLLSLPERATAQALPPVEVVDMRRQRKTPSGHALLSGPLDGAIRACLEAGDQAILFLNRRGFAPNVRCLSCGEAIECPTCSVTLTEHRREGLLRCHYCDFARPRPGRCPSCDVDALASLGLGTEQLEAMLAERFAPARVARLDRDVAAGKSVEAVLDRLRRKEIDLLVGTQMVTKGHDVPGVTLVGVVLADQSLAFPDFRAAERTYQLLSQVAGRAGRGERAGRVLFQTFLPDHPAITAAAKHDYEGFFAYEREEREALGYPPFGRMVAVRVDAADESRARQVAEGLASVVRRLPAHRQGEMMVLGPAAAPIARLRGRYRFRFLVRGRQLRPVRQAAQAVAARIDEGLGVARAVVDVDPVSML
ncbi:MAG: primosomal protein N' [Myxococcota bacterium]